MICHPCERAKPCKLDTTESLLLLQETGLRWHTAGWLLLRSELSLNAEYSFSDVLSLEWSNLHLSNRFKWMDYASMKLHCFHSLVVESIRQLSLSTRPAIHSFDTFTTPTHQLVKGSEVFAILHSREYFVLIEAFRMYWNERSIPISRHHHFSLSFSLTQPCFISHLLFGSHTHPLTSTESLYHSFQHISPPPYPHT